MKPSRQRAVRWIPFIFLYAFSFYLLYGFKPPVVRSSFNLNGFGQLPVLNSGRIKPLDTIARTSLLMMSGKQAIRWEGQEISAIEWLTETMFQPAKASVYPLFEIDDPDVLGSLGIQQTQKRRFSPKDLASKLTDIERLGDQAQRVQPELRSRFQTAILNLRDRVLLYQRLRNTLEIDGSEHQIKSLQAFTQNHSQTAFKKDLERYYFLDGAALFYPVPLYRTPGTSTPRPWVSIGRGVLSFVISESDTLPPSILAYGALSDSWQSNDPVAFNQVLATYKTWLAKHVPADVFKSRYEFIFNYFEPFYRSLTLYLFVFILTFLSWIVWPKILNRTALTLLALAFGVHTFGLLSRMILQGRPPVTNLYSSAIFVGWAAVLLGLILERIYRNGIGSMAASAIGFITLIIAHHLASTGDTLEMMRAVLDSNFWLATHVVSITIGYGSTFVSGFLAIVYIFRKTFDKNWNTQLATSLERMVYGIVCFSTLFSFVGTILGGIWADQSWGRFWGWDPKENGALMIVLWNVFILHARWGKYALGKNLMLLAVVGNIVTALSWFGVNMLGIGLHSYGFMDKAFVWLMLFIASQLFIIFFSLFYLPQSHRRQNKPVLPH